MCFGVHGMECHRLSQRLLRRLVPPATEPTRNEAKVIAVQVVHREAASGRPATAGVGRLSDSGSASCRRGARHGGWTRKRAGLVDGPGGWWWWH